MSHYLSRLQLQYPTLDFSEAAPERIKDKIKVRCPLHGVFERTVEHLLDGRGCPACDAALRTSLKDLPPAEKFIAKAKAKFGALYTYEKTQYTYYQTPVTITCPRHGDFQAHPQRFLQGVGCPKCGEERRRKVSSRARKTTESFILEARKVHGDKYDYSKSEYVKGAQKLTIICPEHGEFQQRPAEHLQGQGCYKCRNTKIGNAKRKTQEDFVRDARDVHGDTYDYSRVVYKRALEKVEIVCPTHGAFWQTPAKHLSGQGCPECGKKKAVMTHLHTQDEFLRRAREVHGDKYDYSRAVFTRGQDKVEIICPEHGVFRMRPDAHWNGQGCPKCGKVRGGKARLSDNEKFIQAAQAVHGTLYKYDQVEYAGNKAPVAIRCVRHGIFMQRPNDHLDGHGCTSCNRVFRVKSQAGNQLLQFIKSLGVKVEDERRISKRPGDPRWKMDAYLPEYRIGIEYNGLRWHSTKFKTDPAHHLKRSLLAAQQGIRLVHIHEDEWTHKPEVVKHLLTHMLGKSQRLAARKCEVREVPPEQARDFHETYHIQGSRFQPKVSYGLYHAGELVACMSFDTKTSNRANPYGDGLWELIRFSSKYAVAGGASKLFKRFVREKHPLKVVSFSMNHLFTGGVYERLGFRLDGNVPIDYTYVDLLDVRRLHKSNFQHSRLRLRFTNYDESLTEEENCRMNGFYRIYDCGKKRWVWERS